VQQSIHNSKKQAIPKWDLKQQRAKQQQTDKVNKRMAKQTFESEIFKPNHVITLKKEIA
jgi:hypothetical protein